MNAHQGSCYCGNITVTVTTESPLSELTPRACGCNFCTMHGAAWVSTPDALLEIEIQNEAAINLFEQGSETARLWLCQRCGVVPAVTCDIDGSRKGAINANVMLERSAFPPATPSDPQNLSPQEKKDRWADIWINKVVIKDCWDVGL
ncbi:GFA family protein [Kordiimonas aquimaris]|uniref:GFA family protein n=1 Tax=Kordiimonas aquimaris TaxID=707591 RepID=UPI0021D11FD3|nr:hypothetical protein [Kordiimonas aquimaris]